MTDPTPCDTPILDTITPKPWFVYLVRAQNGSLYCGISDDPHKRFAKHQSGKGARFFCSSPAVALVYIEAWDDKGEALRQERLIKKLRKSAKENLAAAYIHAGDATPSLPTGRPSPR